MAAKLLGWLKNILGVCFRMVGLQTPWTGQDGGTQQGYQVIAGSVLSARTVRPGGKAGQQGQATDALRRAHEQQPPTTGYEVFDQTSPYDDDFRN